jgi:hypothetical protein
LQLPPRAPELNGQENIWQFMRQNWLSPALSSARWRVGQAGQSCGCQWRALD